MDWRLFASTFALIFLAELGDKTQLAAMAATAGGKSPISVFAGASVALVLSTLVAVVVGSTLQKYLPEHYLKMGAAILFLVFGALLLVNALKSTPTKEAAVPTESKPGLLARVVLEAALDFEAASSSDYVGMADKTTNSTLRALFTHLAQEEKQHISHLRDLGHGKHDIAWHNQAPPLPPLPVTKHDIDPESEQFFASALEHERATAAFYDELARTAPIPAIRNTFSQLATEERSHVAHLEEFASHGTFEGDVA